MLLATDGIGGIGRRLRVARCGFGSDERRSVCSSGLLDWAQIRRHRHLLEQQAEERKQRNPTM